MSEVKIFVSDCGDWNLWKSAWEMAILNRKKYLNKIWYADKELILLNLESWDNVVVFEDVWCKNLQWDALITTCKNKFFGVLVWDCLPIILYDEESEIIACIHAWWRWTYLKIVQKTLRKIEEMGFKIRNIRVYIWPSISKESYEVWSDVASLFDDKVKQKKAELWKYWLDLKQENVNQLMELWVDKENIETSSIDTFTDKNYFSARRWDGWRFWVFVIQE